MPQLAIAPSFLDDFSRMDRAIQMATLSVMRDFIAGRRVAASEATAGVRVLNLGPEWSGVVVPTSDDLYCLVTVCPHDEAVAFARSYQTQAASTALPAIPAQRLPVGNPGREPAGADTPFTVPDELRGPVGGPFAEWRTFLPPAHRELTNGTFRGPFLVSGNPATGTGVIATQRAAVLARRLEDGAVDDDDRPQRVVLVTAEAARAQTATQHLDELLPEDNVRARVDVTTIGSLARTVVAESLGHRPQVRTREELVDDWQRMASADGVPFSGRFLLDEWEQVILARGFTEPTAYLRCDRNGRRQHLAPEYRRSVWRTIQRYVGALRSRNSWGSAQLAARAAETLRRSRPRCRHVVVDEVQAFHPTQSRLVRALTPPDTDDLFLVGDPAQRVTDSRVSLASLGIGVRGRARILRRGYRVTREIEEFAVAIRSEGTTRVRPSSILCGPRPIRYQASNRSAEYAALTQRIRRWLEEGTEPHAIAVAGRDVWMVRRLAKELAASGIRTAPVTAVGDSEAVRLDTVRQIAGQEYRRVALVGLSDALIPPRAALRSADGDSTTLGDIYRSERVVLYAAAMSARESLYVSWVDTPSRLLPAE